MTETAALRRPSRRHAGPPSAAEAASRNIAGLSASMLIALFFLSLMIPIEPRLGPIRMTPYNALQIVLFVPLLLRFRNDPSNRIAPIDLLVLLHVLWMAVAIYVHHGTSRAVYMVNSTVTIFGGYLIGRVMIRSAEDYKRFFDYFFWGLLIFLPFAMVELVTRHMLVSEILAKVFPVHPRAGQPPRLGLNRVQGFAEHSIIFGLYCSLGVANFFYIYRDDVAKRLSRTGVAVLMTFMSLSSGPVIGLGIQLLLMAWDRSLRLFAYRWWVLGIGSVVLVSYIQLGVEGGLVGLVIRNLTFDPNTGYGRTDVIFVYGSQEVMRHPIFGIGFNDWVRPWWKKPSVDNFWLLTAMRFGLPALLALVVGLGVHAVQIMRQRRISEAASSYRRGYLVAWVGAIFVLATVAIWGSVAVMIMAYIGAGAWFYTGDAGQPPERAPRRGAAERAERAGERAAERAGERAGDRAAERAGGRILPPSAPARRAPAAATGSAVTSATGSAVTSATGSAVTSATGSATGSAVTSAAAPAATSAGGAPPPEKDRPAE